MAEGVSEVVANRVALVASSYHPYTGGVEEHVRNVARELRDLGHDVAVWTVDRFGSGSRHTADSIEVRHLPTPLPARSGPALIRFGLHAPGAWRQWMRAYRGFRPDLLHVQCFGPNGVYALALHQRTDVPLIISSHGETFADDSSVFSRSRLLTNSLRKAINHAAEVTGCSSPVLDDLRTRFGLVEGITVPNGIDLHEHRGTAELELPGWWPSSGPVLLAVGRVEHTKGFDLLLRALAIADVPTSTRLVVGGDGTALESLRSMTAQLGLTDRVVFPGWLSRPEVAGAMGAADVVVVPSRAESFGLVALEAWRGGTPLVMTNRGGARDYVSDEVDGLLVDPTDTDQLAATITRLVRDPALRTRLARAGRHAVQGYTWRRVATEYEALYDAHIGR